MAKPTILTLDDDPEVLRAIERDLRSQYGQEYRIARADSGTAALALLEGLKRRGDAFALFLVDQRMPHMTGVEFLERAVTMFPDAKRVLLTAYADTDAAIRAINAVQIDYYLVKPWSPPEEKLYPVLTDLLADWRLTYQPSFAGIRVVGYQWAPASHQVKDFLARNNVPYLWLDLETSEEAGRLLTASGTAQTDLPCLLFPDGSVLLKPENLQIAQQVGLQTVADQPLYDLVVVGAGPAGLAAAVYGASEGLRTVVVEQQAPGGQAGMSSRIENYLGFPGGLSGAELAHRAVTQARRFGVEILTARTVVGLEASGPQRSVRLDDGTVLHGRSVLITTGVSYRRLEAKGIDRLTGAGVYYGAAMGEGESVRGQPVFIVGGANSAGQAAMYFSRFADSVTMLVRGKSLSQGMSRYLIDQIERTANIRVWTQSRVEEALGDTRLEQLVVDRNGAIETLPATALFILIGAHPNTDWVGDLVARDEHGFILSGFDAVRVSTPTARTIRASLPDMAAMPSVLETSLPGVFVAGDVRSGSVKRVASAVGEGSMAVMYVHRYLNAV
jgi:thioredoxin reductase (NADPH)